MSAKKTSTKVALSVVLLAALGSYLVLQKGVSGGEILDAMAKFGPAAVGLALACILGQCLLFVVRIWLLFPGRAAMGFFQTAHAVLYGQFVNMFVPARAGDVLKAVIFAKPQTADRPPVTMMTAAGVIIADKIVDIVSLVLVILITGAYAVPTFKWAPQIPPWALWAIPAIAIVGAGAWKLFLRDKLRAVAGWWENFKAGFGGLVEPKRVGFALVAGCGVWLFEGLAFKILCDYQGFPITLDKAVFILLVLNLAISIPVSFANLGPFEAAIVFAITSLGGTTTAGLAVAAAHHAIQLVAIAIAAGMVALVRLLRPAPSSESLASEFRVQLQDKVKAIDYFEKVSGNYDGTVSKGILKIPRDRERASMLKFAKLDEVGKSIIDVGCGAGFYSLEAKRAGMYVHAVDASAGMVMRLEGKVDEAEVADIEKIDTDRKYDRVVCAGVLDFVMQPEISFRNLCRLVKPGGRLVVLCPRKGPGGLFYRVEKFFFGIHINLYTRHWLSRLAETEGVRLVDYEHPLPTNMALLFEKTT